MGGMAVTLERSVCDTEAVQIALVLFPGVSINECEAFTLAFRQLGASGLGDCVLVGVGAERGEVVGIGGRRWIQATFDETPMPDVVLVPGGLGVDRVAHDERLLSWLRAVEPTCQWIAASSTGTVVAAAAGLLGDQPAATHWLAGDKLAEFGSKASAERIVEVGHVLTCHGRISAMDVALLMILRLFNRATAAQVRYDLLTATHGEARRSASLTERLRAWWVERRGRRAVVRPPNAELISSDWVEIELEPDPSAPTGRSPWDRPK
jgi:transcriptional regulator GlxA family with amidase domain